MNAALATLVYVPRADYYGPELLHFVVDDGLTFAERFIAVTITPVADIVADTLTINETRRSRSTRSRAPTARRPTTSRIRTER